jgi:beta-glucosidase
MVRLRSLAAAAVTVTLVGTIGSGGASAGTHSLDSRVNELLSRMTLQEKLEQLQLLPDYLITDDEVRRGLGSALSLTDPVRINQLQHVAVEQSRLHIPLLFAFDTIHGFRTVFPIPLGAASSFDPSVAADDDRLGARESAAVGLKQIYGPMVDVSHEPRWGRIAEGAGEDPYLGSVLAAARVGDDQHLPPRLRRRAAGAAPDLAEPDQ